MTRNTSDALPFVRERLGAGQRLTAPDKLGWNRKNIFSMLSSIKIIKGISR